MKRQLYAKPGNSPVNNFLRRQQEYKEKGETETVFDWVVGRLGRAICLLVFEGEIPDVDSLCSGDVDDIVKRI